MKVLIIWILGLCSLVEYSFEQCAAGFSQVPYGSQSYCIKCDTSCITCTGANINNCVTCPNDFIYDSTTARCNPPYSNTIWTLQSSYRFYGFNKLPSWLPSGALSQTCGIATYLSGNAGPISTLHKLQYHYKIRVLVSFWWKVQSSYGNINILINTTNNGGNSGQFSKSYSAPVAISNPAYDNATDNSTGVGIQAYETDSRAINVDEFIITTGDPYLTVQFSSPSSASGSAWGIREYIFIEYRCNVDWCSKCLGVQWNKCTQCVDPYRVLFNNTNQCRCDSVQRYYKHPDADYCVKPCPSRPLTGQYYGDPQTKSCLLTCPIQPLNPNWQLLFADDVLAQCVQTCSLTIVLGSVTKPLFHDRTNRKCVADCPTTEPYSVWQDRTCYSTCPSNTYKYSQNMSCVTQCPTNTPIPLYANSNTGSCVQKCVDAGYWADPLTHKCDTACSGGASWFKDSSTGRNLCVQICPFPSYFGNSASGTCVFACPSPNFGDMHSSGSRYCVSRCSGNYYGLLTGNRTCVETCPLGTWGQRATYTCILNPTNCDGTRYADSHIKLCVDGGTCSLGMFSSNTTRTCVINCPSGEFAQDRTKFCNAGCDAPLFADPGINYCVSTCYTQDLYADIDSSRTCVAACNQGGNFPFRDPSTKKCVNICPTSPDLYADSIQGSCVYNCTPNTYADRSTANYTCVQNCPDLTGSGGNIYFSDISTGYGICIIKCPDDPPLFGDIVNGYRICVSVCRPTYFGDQDENNNRHCVATCPNGWFAQNDALRLCVKVCKPNTYGYNLVCQPPQNCPANYVGDPSTNLCKTLCPPSEGTFADGISKLCVSKCPIATGGVIYYADITDRWCRTTCTAPNLYGNNNTQTCESKCIDKYSYADAQSTNRFCIAVCTWTTSVVYYRNNYTKVCVVSTNCPPDYFADNSTLNCVAKCPIVNMVQTWGDIASQTCVQQCYNGLFGDASSGVPLCIPVCPSIPAKWAYSGDHTCVTVCPTSPPKYGEDFSRTCVDTCPNVPISPYQTFSYSVTRRCLKDCPKTFFADYTQGVCWPTPQQCTFGWGDAYNNICTNLCTGPTPWDSFGDNSTSLCTILCSANSYADNYTGTRICVATCPGAYTIEGISTGTYDTYGDSNTWRCVYHCLKPNTWADWQTHRCQSRCSGDIPTNIPTYSEDKYSRCVIAKACPILPDKLFGDNNTRTCLTTCINDGVKLQWADNITRTCLPQCLTTTPTRYYGDLTTNSPICVIVCAQSPRQFGQNSTNKCVAECPDHQYGDQTGNRSCVSVCPLIGVVMWFSQITERICVLVCQKTTYGNVHNSHCQTVPTDCIAGQYGDGSVNLCVPLCPLSMNYFGDSSTKLCVSKCPTLLAQVVNVTANINMPPGYTYADDKTRLCVYTCPSDNGLHGTFGDNTTNTCVQRCPDGSWGDSQRNRYCVNLCTISTYADSLTNRCVSTCPASPPYFGQPMGWTCVSTCPSGYWADSSTRTCVTTCPPDSFRLTTSTKRECVNVCPSQPDLYGDPNTKDCTLACSGGYYADPIDRMCKTSCLTDNSLFQYSQRCVKLCPSGYYANNLGNCVLPASCQANTYAENRTTNCVATCPGGSFADSISRYCIAICPIGWWGDVNVCVQTCASVGTSLSNITKKCQSSCPKFTYSEAGFCTTTCLVGYANDVSGTCANTCPAGLYADPVSHKCLDTCVNGYYKDLNTWFCTNDCSPKFKDYVTNSCVDKCSLGYWGNTANHVCQKDCVTGQYGYQSSSQRTCYIPLNLPLSAPQLFADPISRQFIAVCPIAPIQYFGDRILKQCVNPCQSHSATTYYGDPQTRQCQSTCQNPSVYTADPNTGLCALRCSINTYRFNNTPICQNPCSTGYGDPSTRTCVQVCPIQTDTFGFYDTSNGDRVCLEQCPLNFYAQPVQRTCTSLCPSPLFAYNVTTQCVTSCPKFFADSSNRICMDKCNSLSYPNADNSTNTCVSKCPSTPDYYGDNHVCVYYCTTPNYMADPDSRTCVSRCPVVSGDVTYGDILSGRCVLTCPLGYYGDNSTNLCRVTCPSGSFADNSTRKCVAICPKNQNIYGDSLLHVCAYTCSGGRFGSQINQQCIPLCDNNYWGDSLTTLCVPVCPAKIYSYGQNITRTCVSSCAGYSGFADNFTRLCRNKCQDTITPQTFSEPNTLSCVEICPSTYYAQMSTQQCLKNCLTGYADNYSQFCVPQCPDNPELYGDQILKTCVYACARGQFRQNVSNLCVQQCPSTPDYYGDPNLGKCVLFCTEGSYAQTSSRQCKSSCQNGEFADNYTRRCVSLCPSSQETFGDTTTNKCVRICPNGWYAEKTQQLCVSTCPKYANGTETYSDITSKYCVQQCPYPFFGHNLTHECVPTCPQPTDLYGHYQGRVCVIATDCYKVSGEQYFSDQVTRICVTVCPQTLWANKNNYKCVATCPTTYYRNLHNQICVNLCPSDPDQYADPTSGNCVRTCPSNSYAYATTGFRECIIDCSIHNLYKDNITNRCVGVCPTKPYMYSDILTGKCVLYCSGGYFRDNKTQSCVSTCPISWQYYGNTLTFQCISQCPDGYWADNFANRECVNIQCQSGYFQDDVTSKCVQHCSSIKPYYYEDMLSMKCVDICPGNSVGYNLDQTCVYASGGVYLCPGLYFADLTLKQCVLLCPNGTYANIPTKTCDTKCSGIYFSDPPTATCATICSPNTFSLPSVDPLIGNRCVQFCPSPYFAQNSTKSCTMGCSTLLALSTTNSCQTYCPEPYFADTNNKVCTLNCAPKYADSVLRKCISPCNSTSYNNPLTFECVSLCPLGYFGQNTTRDCGTTCLTNSYADPSLRICVAQCPDSPLLFADSRSNQCVDGCISPLFAYQNTRKCVPSCPNVTSPSNLIFLADTFLRTCVLECVSQETTYADYTNNVCTDICPSGTFASNRTKECVPVCPVIPDDTFSDNVSKICLKRCKPNTYGQSRVLNCVTNCWWPTFADDTTNLCVQFCPVGYFAQNSTARCVRNCPSLQYADSTTYRCVAQCPKIQNLFKHDIGWVCLASCPTGFYADENTRKCTSICDSDIGLYAYSLTNECLRECPSPYKGYDVNHTCILDCPNPYFYNKTRNVCTKCPNQCLVCTGPFSCTQCKVGYNLFNGICNTSCQPTDKLITFAHPTTGVCIQVCPSGYYGDVLTYTCLQTCPVKQYGSNDTHRCQNCPLTCSACKSELICTLCEGTATLAIDNMCYKDCNSTHKYHYNNTCFTQCPTNTFLSYTNVNCQVCAPVCLTCTKTASNCTSCSDRYFYKNSCVVQCPQGFYGSTTKQCLSCQGSTASACSTPLQFRTTVYIQNFTYIINVTFNQKVNFSREVQDILKVKLQLQRRLLSAGDLINSGVPFTWQLLPDGTIKLYLKITDNLVNPIFVVQVTDPTAITSITNGGTLQNSQSEVPVDKVEYYSPSISSQAQTNMAATFTVIFVLLLYAITFLFSDTIARPIQYLQLLALHVVVNVQIPASMYYYLYALKPSLLQFLPNWLGIGISPFTVHLNSPLKVIDVFVDYNFLRNTGHILFLIVLLLPFFFLFGLLSNHRLMTNKLWRGFFRNISTYRFRKMIINDVLMVLFIPILWFGFMQFQDMRFQGYQGFNAFMAIILVVLAIFIPIVWFVVWVRNSTEELSEGYWFMTHRLKTEPSRTNLNLVMSYIHLLLCVSWMTGFYYMPEVQMYLLMVTHFLYIGFLLIIRPHSNCLNTLMEIAMCVAIMVVEAIFLFFYYHEDLNATQKTAVATPVLISISVILVASILWAIWRCIWEIMYLLNSFKQTQFYKVYADPQHEVSQIMSEKFESFDKPVQIYQEKAGDIMIDRVFREVAEDGNNIIKVRKRVLKKKKKQAHRIAEQDEQFVRINKVNPFDYEQKPQEKVPQKRYIDDDVRDVISEDSNTKTQQQKAISLEQNQMLILDPSEMGREQYEQRHEEEQMEQQKTSHISESCQSTKPVKQEHVMYHLPPEDRQYLQQEDIIEGIQDQVNGENDPKYEKSQQGEGQQKLQQSTPKRKEVDKALEELLQDEQKNKRKLLFLFDELEDDE